MEDKKKIEIVSGDGKNLDISPVYEHITPGKPNSSKKPTNIVIPKNEKEKKEEDSSND